MAQLIYALCALMSLACAVLLLRSYAKTRFRLLFWSGLCFAVLTLNNLLLVLDRVVFPAVDMTSWRLLAAASAVALIVFGLVWEEK